MEKFFVGLCVGAFVILMAMRGAALRDERNALAARVDEQQRVITQLANRPTPAPVIIRVPAEPVVVYAPVPTAQWAIVGVYVVLAVFLVVGGLWVLVLMLGAGRVRDSALHPGQPGFDEALHQAATDQGGAAVEVEGAYWLMVPGREPARVTRLIGCADE